MLSKRLGNIIAGIINAIMGIDTARMLLGHP
jgi:hypothetical protein